MAEAMHAGITIHETILFKDAIVQQCVKPMDFEAEDLVCDITMKPAVSYGKHVVE